MIANRYHQWWCLAALCVVAGCSLVRPENRLPDVKQMRKKRSDEAYQQFENHRNTVQFDAAKSFMKNGNYRACSEQLQSLLERQPKNRQASLMLLEALVEDGRVDDACKQARSTMEKFPDDAEILRAAGYVFDESGDEEQAFACFDRATRREGSASNSIEAGKVRAASHGKEPLKASAAQATSRRESVVAVELLKAELCLALGREEEAANRVVRLQQSQPSSEEAEELANRLGIPVAPQPMHDAEYADVRSQPMQDVALASDDAAVADDSTDQHSAQSVRAVVHRANDRGQAGEEVETSRPLRAMPRANANFKVSDRAVRPAAKANESSDRLLAQATTALVAGSTDVAETALVQLIEQSNADEAQAVQAALVPLRHDQAELSADLAARALQRWPRSARLLEIEATAHYRLRQFHAARVALERAMALDDRHASTHFLLGSTLRQLGQTEAGDEHLRKAARLDARYAIQP